MRSHVEDADVPPLDAENKQGVYIVPAVDRAARILSLLRTRSPMTIAEIVAATGWHKSSVHKLVVTLSYHGLLDRDKLTRRYSLGCVLAEYGRMALKGLDIRNAARSYLKDLVDFSNETAALSILRGTKVVLVDVEEPQIQVRVSLGIGMSAPATATSNGKVILAWLPEDRIGEIIGAEGLPSMTENSITEADMFRSDLAVIRQRGYATDFEEYQEGISGVSAPIRNSNDEPIGALCIAVPSFRMTKDKALKYGRKCAEATIRLSAMLR
jgi:DNA-binding IclR family transcriptional regulator